MRETGPFTFYEFFAGGGMARAGLGAAWSCLFANDFDPAKGSTYAANFGDAALRIADVWSLEAGDLPGRADLAWASFPCQDLSLAGARGGLKGARSGSFFGFWRLIGALAAEGRAPRTIGIENVTGLLTSHGGADFAALCAALAGAGYRFGALEIDAARFLPQSRPRLFVIAALDPDPALCGEGPGGFHSSAVQAAAAALSPALARQWLWWRLPEPPLRNLGLADVLDPDAAWFDEARTRRLVELMAEPHLRRLRTAEASGRVEIGTAFRRTRIEQGRRVQRAELRFDGVAGCLRTPAGGSSRQLVVRVEGPKLQARLVTPREAARLMGLADDYRLPRAAAAGLHVCGDGVAAPVVRHLAEHLLEPLLSGARRAAA